MATQKCLQASNIVYKCAIGNSKPRPNTKQLMHANFKFFRDRRVMTETKQML